MAFNDTEGKQDFVDDYSSSCWKEFDKEEIQMKLDKVDEMEKKIGRLETEIRIIHQRIKRLQGQKKDDGKNFLG